MTRVFHREVTRLKVMFCGLCRGQDMRGLLILFGGGGTGLEAEAVVSGLQNVAAVGEAVEQRSGHLGIAKDAGPFAEAEVSGDDDAGAFVKLAQKVEEQGTTRGAERQVAQLVQDGRRSGIDPGDQFPEDGGRGGSGFRRSVRPYPWPFPAPAR